VVGVSLFRRPGRRVRANWRFLGRAVRYLAAEAGVRQFLDIGTGLPSAHNTHEVSQDSAPDARIVYVDSDPIVLAHARALLTSTPGGKTAYLSADLRDIGKILAGAAETLDFAQPVALLFLMTLQYVPDSDDPHAIVRGYLDALAPGSFLVVSDTIMEGDNAVLAESARRMNQGMGGRVTQTRRPLPEFARFFDGLEMFEPGIVSLNRWRPGPDEPVFERDIRPWPASRANPRAANAPAAAARIADPSDKSGLDCGACVQPVAFRRTSPCWIRSQRAT
jgi:SAM-dependent methyltransferase